MPSQSRQPDAMPLWVLTIVICSLIWVIGTAVVVLGATWLVRHEPH